MKPHFLLCPECHAPDLFSLQGETAEPGVGPQRSHGMVSYPRGTTHVGCEACGRRWDVPSFERLLGRRDPRIHKEG